MESNKRKYTRNKMWPETEATVFFRDSTGFSSKTANSLKGHVANLGSDGCFIFTAEMVPSGTHVDIVIDFQPDEPVINRLEAAGTVIRSEEKGIAVKFDKLDTEQLGNCILEKLNSIK